MNAKLPIVNSISYSALSDWEYCPRYYKLINVDRLRPYKETPETIFGKYIHSFCQNILTEKISPEEASKQFERKWKKFCGIFKVSQDFLKYTDSGKKIILSVKEELKKIFGNFTVVKTEQRISMPSGARWPQKFRGFIDIVLKLENGNTVIADFKTANSVYMYERYKTRFKDYQLVLYKYFLCLEKKANPESVETYFIILEKGPNSKKPITTLKITSSKIKTKNALLWLDTALSAINREVFIRNRMSCHLYGFEKPCMFHNSEYCPKK